MALHPAFGGPEVSTVTTTPRIRVNGMCATDYRSPRPSQQYVQGTLDVSRDHGLTDGNAPAGTVRRCSNAAHSRAYEPRRCHIAVVRTTTQLHRRGWAAAGSGQRRG